MTFKDNLLFNEGNEALLVHHALLSSLAPRSMFRQLSAEPSDEWCPLLQGGQERTEESKRSEILKLWPIVLHPLVWPVYQILPRRRITSLSTDIVFLSSIYYCQSLMHGNLEKDISVASQIYLYLKHVVQYDKLSLVWTSINNILRCYFMSIIKILFKPLDSVII